MGIIGQTEQHGGENALRPPGGDYVWRINSLESSSLSLFSPEAKTHRFPGLHRTFIPLFGVRHCSDLLAALDAGLL